ncbi:AMP-binding protein [Pikeienuella piscinae]|uniref:AMP-binding protein n=1 Tax=Pikeienuella piscinae TaxID=2748098 RepID=A0A7L5BW63_9RHOB|nr:AMP-binding protein [Pikeienuella piscinae]QIE56115.1 AMP-binding protein [Pikeienuella piscinae]
MTGTVASDADGSIDRNALEARGAKGAGALIALGVRPDDVVATILRNDLAHLEVMRATALAGAVLCQLNWHGAAREVEDILTDCDARAVIVHRDLVDPLAQALKGRTVIAVTPGRAMRAAYGVSPEAAAARPDLGEWAALRDAAAPFAGNELMRPILRYTSGSTGRPKGIRRATAGLTKDSAETRRRIAVEMMRMRPGGRFLTAAPLYHSAPSSLTTMAMATPETSVHILPRFDAEGFLRAATETRATHIYLVPTMMSRMLKLPDEVKARYDLSAVEFCLSTGSPFPHDLKTAMIDWWGPVFWESYGASEIGFMTMVSSAEALARPGTAGRVQMGGSILILDAEGNALPPGAVGDIHVRVEAYGDFAYSNDPEGRKEAERRGHVSVGDMGWLDEEGYLFISDRKKDMIISGGANIFPAEIEGALIEAPFIADAAVFGAPDVEFGERIVAAIQPAAGWSPDRAEVLAWLDGRLARMKHPRVIEFHDALPREDSGKIFKARLRAPYWRDAGRNI